VVALPPAALDGREDQLAGPPRGRAPRIELALRKAPEPRSLRHFDNRGAAVVNEAECGLDRAAESVARPGREHPASERADQRLHRSLAAVGDGEQLDRLDAATSQPAADRTRRLVGRERALELVRRDED
jgi:hypothetical protein